MQANAPLPSTQMNRALIAMPATTSQAQLKATTEDVPVVLLVGGMGTRLRAVLPSTPKPLALVGETPFLELLVLQLQAQGMRRLVMCTGHLAGQIESQFGDGRNWNVAIAYSRETEPLGTAGALKFAAGHLEQEPEFLVMNGDSFLEMDLRQFVRFHREHDGLASMAVRRVSDAARYGTVRLDPRKRIVGFAEKASAHAPGVINGGVYMFSRSVLQYIPSGPVSLEKQIFPQLLEQGMYADEQDGIFIDIGTPEDYARAQELCRSLHSAAHGDRDRRGDGSR